MKMWDCGFDPQPPKIRHIRRNYTRHRKSAEKSSAKPDISRILMKNSPPEKFQLKFG